MAKKSSSPTVSTPKLTAAYTFHTVRADTDAPEGASWKPDGKFKITGVADSISEFDALSDIIQAAAKAKWGDMEFDEFRFPWVEHEDDDKKEGLRGKTTITAKSMYMPKFIARNGSTEITPKEDTAKGSLMSPVFDGDLIKIAGKLYLYEKTEAVREGRKTVNVTVRGCSIQLGAIQIIERRNTGSNFAGVFGNEGEDEDDQQDSAGAFNSEGEADGGGDF